MNRTTKLAVACTGTLLTVAAAAAPATAAPNQTRQQGLVNVAVTDTTVQVPVAVAANICDVTVNVLASQLADGSAPCDAAADAVATRPTGGDNQTRQDGLVNIALTDTVVQLPIGIAANVCDVSANVLAQLPIDTAEACEAVATPSAG
jgi:hypothetical protein